MAILKDSKIILETLLMFQDGNIESLKYLENDLNFKIECTFLADKIDKKFTSFYGVLKDCSDLYFEPWEDEENIITDPQEISDLKLEILNTELEFNDYFKTYTNCINRFSGGNLFIKAKSILLFDQEFNHISYNDILKLNEKIDL